MGRYRTLLSNSAIFAISNFASKILVFLLLPLYTTALTPDEYGIADLIYTSISLLTPLFTLCISDACLRYCLDKYSNKYSVFTIGGGVLLLGLLILLMCGPIINMINFMKGRLLPFYMLYISGVFFTFCQQFCQGVGKIKSVGIAGVISTIVMALFSILLLIYIKCGIEGYLYSMALAQISASLYLFLSCRLYQYVRFEYDRDLAVKMIKYSTPLVPGTMGWWITNSSNRYILGQFSTMSNVGLYSVAMRIPAIVEAFRAIFSQAWQLSAISEYDASDSNSFFVVMFKYYNTFMIVSAACLIMVTKLLSFLLFSDAFFEAWRYTPIMVLGVFWGSMYAFFQPLFLARKQTKVIFKTSMFAAFLTIVFNLILVPWIHIFGTAISSVVTYFVIYLYVYSKACKFCIWDLSKRRIFISYILLSILAFLISCELIDCFSFVSVFIFILILTLNFKEVFDLYIKIVNTKK